MAAGRGIRRSRGVRVDGRAAPAEIGVVDVDGFASRHAGRRAPAADFRLPNSSSKSVAFNAADGTLVHGQLFQRRAKAAPNPESFSCMAAHRGRCCSAGITWTITACYAVNQYLAAHGFVVLSVNYRLGIGYGRKFHQPDRADRPVRRISGRARGRAVLQHTHGVDAQRIGMWGGSYGGYLTALALARIRHLQGGCRSPRRA